MREGKYAIPNVIARSERILLRKWLASDCDHFVRWLAPGEWLDAVHFGVLREEWQGGV